MGRSSRQTAADGFSLLAKTEILKNDKRFGQIQPTGDLEIIQRKICVIRDVQVMLDRDLADLYQVELRVFNQAVRRNLNRFHQNFMFEVDKEEIRPLITNCDLSEKMRYWPQKSSLKDLGKKCFAIAKLDPAEIAGLKARL